MKLIVLDRDGVINENSITGVVKPENWQLIPGSIEAIVRLKKQGFTIVLATNQSAIAKKKMTVQELHITHDNMQRLLQRYGVQIDQIFFCPHQTLDGCSCRKPKPGMLRSILAQYQITAVKNQIPFVGDSLTDLQAASAIGMLPVLVLTGHGSNSLLLPKIRTIKNLMVFNDLEQFSRSWLNVCKTITDHS